MKASIVSYTQPAPEFLARVKEELGEEINFEAQDLIAYCARVSNEANQFNLETAQKLCQFLIRNKHFSPFEMVNACVEIEITRDIARQLLRHRSMCFQEFSQRYAKVTRFEISEARLQDQKNRQASIEIEDQKLQRWWENAQNGIIEHAEAVYLEALDRGIAKELARKVLPEGLTLSRVQVNGTLRSWIHLLQLRLGNGTQKEFRELALVVAQIISRVFPVVADQLEPELY